MDQIDLSDLFTTKAEANEFLSQLTSISETFFHTGFNLEKALTDHFSVNKCDRLLAILRQNNINMESLPAIKEFFFVLMARVSSLPVLSLTIAFEPQAATLKTISEWFFINMHKQILFEIIVEPNIIAGAHITFNGKFYDFSVKSTFENILQSYLTRLNTTTQNPPPTVPTQQTVKQNENIAVVKR